MTANAYKDLGNVDIGSDSAVPFPAPIFVALYLILITFFIALSHDTNIAEARQNDAFLSIRQKFGKPSDELHSFSQAVKPKFTDYTLELEQIFGTYAQIESTVNGDRTRIIAPKEFYFYPDETGFKKEVEGITNQIADLFARWNAAESIKITIEVGYSNFDEDKKRIENLVKLYGNNYADIALSPKNPSRIVVTIEDTQ